jgi:hypothetical protein
VESVCFLFFDNSKEQTFPLFSKTTYTASFGDDIVRPEAFDNRSGAPSRYWELGIWYCVDNQLLE